MKRLVHASITPVKPRVVVNVISNERRWITEPWLLAIMVICTATGFLNAAFAQTTPLQIRSISFPIIGSTYLDDQPGWTPIPTVIEEIKGLGANDVKVVITVASYDSPTDNLPNPAVILAPADSKIIAFLKQLKAAGLQVTVQPFVGIRFDPNGNLLDTVHAQPTDFNKWMEAHRTKMVHLAQLAQQAGADRFVVFSDEVQPLTWTPAYETGWLNLISQIRMVFSGSLTTIAWADGTILNGGNTHIDLTARPILEAVDAIGVGWFPNPLTNTNSPSVTQLIAGWRKNVHGVDTVAFMQGINKKYNKPVWISDISFHSFSGDNISSNDIYNMAVTLIADQQEQANEYDSLLTVLSQNFSGWFLGVSFDSWNRFPLDFTGTARFLHSEYGQNIKGKLAEKVLTEWYSGQRSLSYQGLWWNPNESGWGINFNHQGDIIFATWYTYDTAGKPWWLIAELLKTSSEVYSGPVSTVAGPLFNSVPFGPTPVVTEVGAMTVEFADAKYATLTYEVDGVLQTKDIAPLEFDTYPTCTWPAQTNLSLATNYTDLWWNANESGWGVNFTHQGDIIFATWYTYDTAGKPWWLIAELLKGAGTVYSGTVSKVSGQAFNAAPWDETKIKVTAVGTATVTFANGKDATFAYTVNSTSQSKSITRFVFRPPGTVCQ